jgi:hypothetical protein
VGKIGIGLIHNPPTALRVMTGGQLTGLAFLYIFENKGL